MNMPRRSFYTECTATEMTFQYSSVKIISVPPVPTEFPVIQPACLGLRLARHVHLCG